MGNSTKLAVNWFGWRLLQTIREWQLSVIADIQSNWKRAESTTANGCGFSHSRAPLAGPRKMVATQRKSHAKGVTVMLLT